MSESPAFRTDLYRGTASFYDRFRRPYPAVMIDDVCRRADVDGTGRLLDLACGPGTVTFALAPRFTEVWAVDQEPEAIELARRKAEATGVRNVRWTAARAEDVEPDEIFDTVAIGTAFHRLDRRAVAARAAGWLRSGGHVVLLWSDTPLNPASPWQEELVAIVVDWIDRIGSRDRVPPELADHIEQLPHTTVLEEAGFVDLARYEFREPYDWTVPELLGLLYSTSLLSLAVVGDHRDGFEADVVARLRAIEPTGRFREDAGFAYDIAYRPVYAPTVPVKEGPVPPFPDGADPDEYDRLRRRVLWTMPSGLYVVGSTDGVDRRNLMTLNWATQLAFEPKLLGVAVAEDAFTHELIEAGGVFSLNIVDREDRVIVRKFTKPVEVDLDGSILNGFGFHTATTCVPVLDQAAAFLDCVVAQQVPTGDHTLFVGEVVDCGFLRDEGTPVLRMEDTRMNYGG